MNRLELNNLVKSVIPTYSIGQLKGRLTKNCAIIRKSADLPSMSNSLGGWDNWYIDIYSPISPMELDRLISQLVTIILDKYPDVEIENRTSGDAWDSHLSAFTSTMAVRCPNTFIKR